MTTNFEKIKSMSVEEMAILLVRTMDFAVKNTVDGLVDYTELKDLHEKDVKEAIQNIYLWLQQEAEEE